MNCPYCNISAIINSTKIVVENADTNADTRVYYEYEYFCRNPECSHYETKIGEELEPTEFTSR